MENIALWVGRANINDELFIATVVVNGCEIRHCKDYCINGP